MSPVSPFSVGEEPKRSRTHWFVGAAISLVVLLASAVAVVRLAGGPDDLSDVPGPMSSTSTTAAPIASGSGTTRPTEGTPPDATRAVYTQCDPIEQNFPLPARGCTLVSPPRIEGRLPAVVLLHGWNSTPSDVLASGRWAEAVVRNQLIVAAPPGLLGGWNAGGCCGATTAAGIDDTTFLTALVEQLRARPDVDPERVFVVGESNGGMMAYRLLCASAGLLAGAASVEGTSVAGCQPSEPIDLLHIHGTADQVVPYGGGQSFSSWLLGVTFLPVPSSLDPLVASQGCGPSNERTTGLVRSTEWTSCAAGRRVRLVTIDGQPHSWPGAPVYDATTEILRFFGIVT